MLTLDLFRDKNKSSKIYFFFVSDCPSYYEGPCRGDFPDLESLLWEATDETLVASWLLLAHKDHKADEGSLLENEKLSQGR